METIGMNWADIAALIVALAAAGAMIYLFKTGKLQASALTGIAGLMEQLGHVLEDTGNSGSIVKLFADYAAKAVRVVEQLVKNGELEKDNALRKQEAMSLVETMAVADGMSYTQVHENKALIADQIEATVNEMQADALMITLEETVDPALDTAE